MRKLFLSLFVLAASAGYVAKTAMTEEGGVQTFLDRISFRPIRQLPRPVSDPYGLFDGDTSSGDSLFGGDGPASDAASSAADVPATDGPAGGTNVAEAALPPLTFTPPYDLGPPVPDDTPLAATRVPGLEAQTTANASAAARGDVPSPMPAPAGPGVAVVANAAGKFRDGAYTGSVADAYFGAVQVRANVSGGKVIGVDILKYPSDRRTSRSINSYALPLLQREVVLAQASDVNIITGATLTAVAYVQSLRAALKQAQ